MSGALRRGREVLNCVRFARRRHRLRYTTVAVRLADLYLRRSYSLAEIASLDLLSPSLSSRDFDMRQSKQAQLEMQVALNPREYWSLVEDKGTFDVYCRGAGLRTPTTYGVLHVEREASPQWRDRARRHATALLSAAPDAELLLKPTRGVYGQDVHLLRRDGDRFVRKNDLRLAPTDVYDWLAQNGRFDAYVVQQRLVAHGAIAALSGTPNLQTARIVTYVAATGEVVVGCCQLRIIAAGSLVDNFQGGLAGNLIADIDRATGRVRGVFARAEDGFGMVRVEVHPSTGARFAGFEIPFWEDACELVTCAARAMLPMRTIGWDVAITDHGAMLVEGNVTWDPAYEGEVGAEILEAIMADRRRA
jgi:hypothetical protein